MLDIINLKSNLAKQFRDSYAVSRTTNAVNLIDIKGRSVYKLFDVRNSAGRNQRLLITTMEHSGDRDDIFKLIFVRETQAALEIIRLSKPTTPE